MLTVEDFPRRPEVLSEDYAASRRDFEIVAKAALRVPVVYGEGGVPQEIRLDAGGCRRGRRRPRERDNAVVGCLRGEDRRWEVLSSRVQLRGRMSAVGSRSPSSRDESDRYLRVRGEASPIAGTSSRRTFGRRRRSREFSRSRRCPPSGKSSPPRSGATLPG